MSVGARAKVFQFDKDLQRSFSLTKIFLFILQTLIYHSFLQTLFTNSSFREHKIASFRDPTDFTIVEQLHINKGKRQIIGKFSIRKFPKRESNRNRFTNCSEYNFGAVRVNIHNYNFANARQNNERLVTIIAVD